MRIPGTNLALLLAFPVLLSLSSAQEPAGGPPGAEGPEEKAAAQEVLRGLRKSHASQVEEGLRSFRARLEYLDLQPGRTPLTVVLDWKGPGKEEFTLLPAGPTRGKRKKGRPPGGKEGGKKNDWRTAFLRGVGDALAGASFHSLLAKGDRAEIDPEKSGGGKTVVQVFRKKHSLGRAVFSKATGLLEKIRVPPWERTFGYTKTGGRWVLDTMTLAHTGKAKGNRKGKGPKRRVFKFTAYRKINGFFLPTRIAMAEALGPVDVSFSYVTVNGGPALSDAADPKAEAKAIGEFESGWRSWKPERKIEAVRDLARMGGPKAALALARRLRDRSPEVRAALARALGDMKEPAALPYLLRALAASRKDPAFFVLICKALGRIGDRRAVKPLAKKILSGDVKSPEWKILAQARISALASIRSPESVDELIKLLSMSGGRGRRATSGRGRGPLAKYVQAALTKLTGERFKFAYQWHKWWKAHRAGFFRKKR